MADPATAGWDALRAGRWQAARASFEDSLAIAETPEAREEQPPRRGWRRGSRPTSSISAAAWPWPRAGFGARTGCSTRWSPCRRTAGSPSTRGTSRTRAETRQRRASSESAPPSSPSRWVEADAESLPFGDAWFDVVTSCFGAMFALDHETVASELVRVCRPGGTIGLASFTPRGTGAAFFDVLARHAPPPPAGVLPPVLWGDEEHVRSLFRDRVASLDVQRRITPSGQRVRRTIGGSSRRHSGR